MLQGNSVTPVSLPTRTFKRITKCWRQSVQTLSLPMTPVAGVFQLQRKHVALRRQKLHHAVEARLQNQFLAALKNRLSQAIVALKAQKLRHVAANPLQSHLHAAQKHQKIHAVVRKRSHLPVVQIIQKILVVRINQNRHPVVARSQRLLRAARKLQRLRPVVAVRSRLHLVVATNLPKHRLAAIPRHRQVLTFTRFLLSTALSGWFKTQSTTQLMPKSRAKKLSRYFANTLPENLCLQPELFRFVPAEGRTR